MSCTQTLSLTFISRQHDPTVSEDRVYFVLVKIAPYCFHNTSKLKDSHLNTHLFSLAPEMSYKDPITTHLKLREKAVKPGSRLKVNS